MRLENIDNRDPRLTLMRDKFFSMRPKPLEQWIWRQSLPQTVERVFWFHWDQGAKNGTWCSQIPIRIVARECCVDPSTVSRAYQCLKSAGLIRREEPPRDPTDPFRQLVAVTEVLAPRDLVRNLSREPNRGRLPQRSPAPSQALDRPVDAPPSPTLAPSDKPAAAQVPASRTQTRAVLARLSDVERARMYEATRLKSTNIEFDANTDLDPAERAIVLGILESTARTPAASTAVPIRFPASHARLTPKNRRLPVIEVVRVHRELSKVITAQPTQPRCQAATVATLLQEILWSVEEGTLAQFSASMAVNIALKKIRLGEWRRPHRMPPQWCSASPETCSVAGV